MQTSNVLLCINVPEGWQRIIAQNKIRATSCNNMFLQSSKHSCFAGAPGFYHTLSDAKSEVESFKLNIYGPTGLSSYMNTFRAGYGGLKARWIVHELAPLGKVVKKPIEEEKEEHSISSTIESTVEVDKKLKVIPVFMKGANEELSYIVQPYEEKPKFKGKVAKEMGLTVPQIKALTSGQSVTLADGKVVTSAEMHEKPFKPPAAIFLYVQSMDHIQSLIKSMELANYFEGKTSGNKASLIYHTVTAEILTNPLYLDYVAKFGKSALHILDCKELIEDMCPRQASFHFVKTLHACNSRLFPDYPNEPMHKPNEALKAQILDQFSKRGLKAKIALMGAGYSLLHEEDKETSSAHLDKDVLKKLDSPEKVKESIEAKPHLKELQQTCETVQSTKNFKNEPFFVMLGTASQKPSKRRGLSGVYINVPGKFGESKLDPRKDMEYYEKSFGILADCGEGTFGQLVDHFYNPKVLSAVIHGLRVIFIGHHHGDHTFGIGHLLEESEKILLERYKISDAPKVVKEVPLYILIPNLMKKYMEATIKLSCPVFGSRIRLISTASLNPCPELYYSGHVYAVAPTFSEAEANSLVSKLYKRFNPALQELWHYLKTQMQIPIFYSFETNHTPESHGMIMHGPDWKAIYTGDTVPCTTLESFGRKADLLIHECTFVDNLKRKEDDIKHTTLNEALDVIKKVQPWRTLLTHFSNKDRRICKLSPEAIQEKVFNAFDHLHFKLSDLEWMHKLVPLLESVITNEQQLRYLFVLQVNDACKMWGVLH
eukprot:TRINITY_DN105909_c0_g1_i1.p1 TRINITY_DN105909_c0_g1~~TRINITY_DN105909_c0_g1_i1.p1  ORF type:complete len:829 (-),score=62.92 TRINITY_DN105909_c0_g1_i1:27-2336(-)